MIPKRKIVYIVTSVFFSSLLFINATSVNFQNNRKELEEIFVSFVKSVFDVIEVFGNLKGSFIIQKSSEDKVTEREIEGE